jgi:hypothetical protein
VEQKHQWVMEIQELVLPLTDAKQQDWQQQQEVLRLFSENKQLLLEFDEQNNEWVD